MTKSRIILGIETSCDETAAAVLKEENGRIQILSNIVSSSASLQSKFGGIIPEQAAREQLKSIVPVIKTALLEAGITHTQIDAIAVTAGPGLIGSLLVGVESAKVLSKIWNKPLIPVNHLIGHFYANWIRDERAIKIPTFPCIGLLVSGGHTDLVLFKNHGRYEYLGGTRDDAAGECFDKCARLLNLPYPGGPQISKHAADGSPTAFNLPRPMHDSGDFDFSFSGLKTAVSNLVGQLAKTDGGKVGRPILNNLCSSLEAAITDSLTQKTMLAVQKNNVEQLIVAGGVAANASLRNQLAESLAESSRAVALNIPAPILCTDNAAMIAAAAFFINPVDNPLKIQANPNLSLAY